MHTLSYHKTDEDNLFTDGTALGPHPTARSLGYHCSSTELYRLGPWREDINHAIGVRGNVHVGHKEHIMTNFLALIPPFKKLVSENVPAW
jgi:hypothetical protein